MSDFLKFTGQLLRHPMQTMALAPSSARLCAEMARRVGAMDGPVIELGGGTGKISKALLAAGLAPENLHTLEINPDFLTLLRDRLPGVNVHDMRAENLADLGLTDVVAVVSGLPLLSMPEAIQRAILEGTMKMVRHNGAFVQFTYGTVPPVRECIRKDLQLDHTVGPRIWWNLPPARVYRFTRKGEV